ncbi:hypothetical protein UFOVP130_7 [uncultured Caudovirales phage]|uniref:Uncharacterized protein n=1 Tax=uncultured Caudovirales phage TaxID=2100421 RepID=A0A6J5LC33_9CAUD|nr:hypothetical protein UFOVP130_7 [uncultured Caudovirales phage]
MGLLIDNILRYGLEVPGSVPSGEAERQRARDTAAIRDMQVAEVIISAGGVTEGKSYGPEDFPCSAPPFPLFWVEDANMPGKTGTLWAGLEKKDALTCYPEFFEANPSKALDCEWLLIGSLYIGVGRKAFCGDVQCVVVVRRDGTQSGRAIEFDRTSPPAWLQALSNITRMDSAAIASGFFVTALLTINMLGCRNVTTLVVKPNPKLQKKRIKSCSTPYVTFRTLHIHSTVSKERFESISQGEIERRLHICRGHFKDYRERGLFGREKGLFWWDSCVRGSGTKGLALKNYAVHLGGEHETTPVNDGREHNDFPAVRAALRGA